MARHWIATRPGGLEVFALEDYALPAPGRGEVRIGVRAAGVNPADAKHVARGDESDFPLPVGYEVAGVITAVGPDTEIGSGAVRIGDEVLAFRVSGGWADELVVPAADVFAKPPGLGFPEAANLLLAGSTAADMLHVTGLDDTTHPAGDPSAGDGPTIVVHGASGAVGVSLLQQAALLDIRVIGTASPARFDVVRRFGGEPVAHGGGAEALAARVRDAAPEGVVAALDCVGYDEAVEASLLLVADRDRIVTIAAQARAGSDGIRAVGGTMPASKAFRDGVRAHLVELAAAGRLVVPMARTFALEDALDAARLLLDGHPGGKLALIP